MSAYRTSARPPEKRRPLLCACMLPIFTFRFTKPRISAWCVTGRARGPGESPPPGWCWLRCERCARAWKTPGDVRHWFLTPVSEDAAREVGI